MIARHKTQFLQIIFLLLGFFTLIQFKWACAGSKRCLARKLSRELIESSQRQRTHRKPRREKHLSWLSVKRGFFVKQYALFIFSTPLLDENVEHTQKTEEGKEILIHL